MSIVSDCKFGSPRGLRGSILLAAVNPQQRRFQTPQIPLTPIRLGV